MTFIQGKKIAETAIEQGNHNGTFVGIAKFLDSTFKTVFSLDENVSSRPQNFNVQNNPFNNTEKIDPAKQLIGGHSIGYVMAGNSVFDNQVSNNKTSTQNFRNERFGNLEFYS